MTDAVVELLEQYRVALVNAAALDAEADHLEEMRKVVLAEQTDTALPLNKAEVAARISPAYIEHLKKLREAKAAAGDARGVVVYIAARLDAWRTRESSRRAQLQHRGE